MADDVILPILKSIQNGITDLNKGQNKARADMNMQFSALNEKLSGQFLSEIEMRHEMQELRERLEKLENRLELS
jgi:hypothetical protein